MLSDRTGLKPGNNSRTVNVQVASPSLLLSTDFKEERVGEEADGISFVSVPEKLKFI